MWWLGKQERMEEENKFKIIENRKMCHILNSAILYIKLLKIIIPWRYKPLKTRACQQTSGLVSIVRRRRSFRLLRQHFKSPADVGFLVSDNHYKTVVTQYPGLKFLPTGDRNSAASVVQVQRIAPWSTWPRARHIQFLHLHKVCVFVLVF